MDAYVVTPDCPAACHQPLSRSAGSTAVAGTAHYQGRAVQPMSSDAGAPLSVAVCAPPHNKRPAAQAVVQDSALAPAQKRLDLGAAFAVNYESPDYVPPEKRMPRPPESPTLRNDDWLGARCHEPDGLKFVEEQLALRRQLEAENKEFTFEPLMASLENMQILIGHIRKGDQFKEPLTVQEDRVMAWLEEKTAILVQDKAPYKRTVQLAVAFVAVCEELTNRRVLRPFKEEDPAFFGQHCCHLNETIDLERLMACAWGGNNPDAAPADKEFFTEDSEELIWKSLAEFLDRDDMLIYPSFQPLQLADFCNAGHLPVHPIGMTEAYALGADGRLLSPLMFSLHDLGHMTILDSIGARRNKPCPRAQAVFHTPAERLAWRQMLCDSLPDDAAFAPWKPALTLLLFQLFHEWAPCTSFAHINKGYDAFLGCLDKLARARRDDRAGYEKSFRAVADREATIAAAWAVRLWQHWQAEEGPLSRERVTALARQFAQTQVPVLEQHLAFVDRHRGTLRQLFARECLDQDQEEDGLRTVRILADIMSPGQGLTLFQSEDRPSGLCNLDNTDLAYFAALQSPVLTQKMAAETRASVPQGLVRADVTGQLYAMTP